ncbi:unnamed protein product [Rotaria sordida]|uniref:Uncharacterized protein n=1 Tax=Rotaria sordida TaxID=392033 RepID=A0A815I4T5_9BILA|nr:unnamed protein product [Rotaria sordida]CAF3937143.1 unnamed protein product [Rotaria sordida]
MGLKYYSKNINNSKNFPLLSSNGDIPSYANTSISNYKKYQNSSQLLSSKTNINTYPYISIQNHDNIDHSIQTSYDFQNNTYANISKSQIKSTYISNETILENATSMTSLSNTEIEINLDIIDKNNNNNNNQIYENIKLCPKLLSSINPFKLNKLLLYQKSSIDNINSCSSSHNYINLQQQSINPIHTILSRKNDQKEKKHCSSIDSLKKEHVDIEINSNTNTTQIVKKLEVNLAPSCRDKSVLYRTKIPSSFHQQQIMHRSKRHSTRPFYANQNSNIIKQQQVSNSNIPLHHPIITDDQWKRSIHKNRQMKSVSNQLYNEIQQSIYSDNQSLNSIYIEKDLCENPMEFHKILQDQIFAWYPTENYNEEDLITQTHSILENDESDKQNEITNLDEEELYRHDTFEDFFLRRRRKSSSSSSSSSSCSTLVNDNKTILSETISHEIPIKNSSLNRHFPSIALGLDKTDVEFIHDIIERSNGDHHRSNRITALREAYIRAINKKLDLIKTKNNSSINENKKKHIKPIKHSFVTSKIRDELEKYDELPVYQRTSFNDDDDDDDIYSVNYQQHIHHCTIPAIVSTVHRISNFISSLKRQLQKNFHNIQSRILIENMSKSSNHISRHRRTFHNSSGHPHRHISRPKTMHNIVHHTNSHHSNEHSHPIHRRQFHSNRSQLQHQHSHQFPSYEQHSSHRKRTFRIIPHQQRLQRIE